MNPCAKEILECCSLPRTETLSVEAAARLPPTEWVYLRYRTGCHHRNSRVPVSEIKANLLSFLTRVSNGDLVSCEKCYRTIVGGITVVKQGFTYSELVQGHSVALLRRGCCGARVLQYADGRSLTMTMVQRWSAEQQDQYLYQPLGEMEKDLVTEVEHRLRVLQNLPRTNILLEWMWTPEGFLFCDGSDLADAAFGDAIPAMFVEGASVVVVRTAQDHCHEHVSGRITCDELDCDAYTPATDGDMILCMNGAVLSHAITRALGKKATVIWLRPASFVMQSDRKRVPIGARYGWPTG